MFRRAAQRQTVGRGWERVDMTPPRLTTASGFLTSAFDYWVDILRTQFPTEVEAIRQAHERTHPVVEMKNRGGARGADPDPRVAREWLEVMKAGDKLAFRRRDGSSLHVMFDGVTHSARWL